MAKLPELINKAEFKEGEDKTLQAEKWKGILNDNGEIIDVPDHILDFAVADAQSFFKDSNINNPKDRLLGAYSTEAKRKICEISTHHIFDEAADPKQKAERRELHRQIILKMIRGKKAFPTADNKPTTFLFAGPPGAGKSTLRKRFEEDIPFEDKHLEEARQIYKATTGEVISPDFELLKNSLPQYKAANTAYKEKYGDMYAVVRCETKGLNQATLKFARELGITTVLEQLMDIDGRGTKEFAELAKTRLCVFGLSCEPQEVIRRVESRKNPLQPGEVSRAISNFSSDGSFKYLSEISDKAYLFDTTDKYKTVFASEKGKETYKDGAAFNKFKEHINFIPPPGLSVGKGPGL